MTIIIITHYFSRSKDRKSSGRGGEESSPKYSILDSSSGSRERSAGKRENESLKRQLWWVLSPQSGVQAALSYNFHSSGVPRGSNHHQKNLQKAEIPLMYFPSNFKQSWLQICSFVFSVSNFQETQIPLLSSVSNASIRNWNSTVQHKRGIRKLSLNLLFSILTFILDMSIYNFSFGLADHYLFSI